jgi:hypothetical protein
VMRIVGVGVDNTAAIGLLEWNGPHAREYCRMLQRL